jgi:release factor glutamine methyltransferase
MKSQGLKIDVSGSVYPPSEDSYLLAKHAPKLKGRILDMCTGSGICALTNAKENPKNKVIGADINPEAIECAKKNAALNGIQNAEFIQSNLFEKVNGKFDGILCNPPYLPETEIGNEAEMALSGGKTGREFTDRFLDGVGKCLADHGTALLLQSSINDKDKTMKKLEDIGFIAEVIDSESFFFEKLFVIKLSRAA